MQAETKILFTVPHADFRLAEVAYSDRHSIARTFMGTELELDWANGEPFQAYLVGSANQPQDFVIVAGLYTDWSLVDTDGKAHEMGDITDERFLHPMDRFSIKDIMQRVKPVAAGCLTYVFLERTTGEVLGIVASDARNVKDFHWSIIEFIQDRLRTNPLREISTVQPEPVPEVLSVEAVRDRIHINELSVAKAIKEINEWMLDTNNFNDDWKDDVTTSPLEITLSGHMSRAETRLVFKEAMVKAGWLASLRVVDQRTVVTLYVNR